MYSPRNPYFRTASNSRFNASTLSTLALAAGSILSYGQTSFVNNIGFDGFQHGSILEPGALSGSFTYISPIITVAPPSGGYHNAVIFATDDLNVPGNPDVEDQDLIPNGTGNVGSLSFGNVAIIQENTSFTISGGRIDDPYENVDDHRNGGTFTFDLNPGADVTIDSIRVDFIDIESSGDIKIVAYDSSGSFTWTGSDLKALQPSIDFDDGSANRTSELTASAAGLTGIERFDIISKTSFAVDNIKISGTVIPEVSSSFLTVLSSLLLCFRRRRQN